MAYTPSDTQWFFIPDGNRNIDLIIDFLNANIRRGNLLFIIPTGGGGRNPQPITCIADENLRALVEACLGRV